MISGIINLTINQGATFVLPITVTELQPDGETYLPMNLTGYTARAQIRAQYSSATAVSFAFSALDSTGIFEATLTAVQTAALAAGDYVWDLELVQGSEVLRLLEGKVKVRPEVTK